LNNQIAHLLDSRTADGSKKLSDKERHRIVNILKDEIARFKAELLPEYLSLDIPEIPPIVFVTGPAGDEYDKRDNEWADRAVWSRPRRVMEDFACCVLKPCIGYAALGSAKRSVRASTLERLASRISPPAARAAKPIETNIGREL
jgi:hypothetical protein